MALPGNVQPTVDARNFDEMRDQYESRLKMLEDQIKELRSERDDQKWSYELKKTARRVRNFTTTAAATAVAATAAVLFCIS